MRISRTFLLAGCAIAACVSLAGRLAAQGDKPKCPVSKMDVTVTEKSPMVLVNGEKVYFCCDKCPKPFAANPEKFIVKAGNCPVQKTAAKVSPESRVVLNNGLYYFCCANCPKGFSTSPARFVKQLRDPVTGKEFELKADSPRAEVEGQIYLFASPDSKAAFEKESAKYVIIYKK